MIGDSDARQFVPALLVIAKELHLRLMVAAADDCPFVRLALLFPPPEGLTSTHKCSAFVSRSLAVALRLRPALVVVADRNAWYIEERDKVLATTPASADRTSDPSQKARLWQKGLEGVLDPLVKRSVPVLFVDSIPEHPGWALAACSALSIRDHSCRRADTRANVEKRRARALGAGRAALKNFPGIAEVDLANAICHNRTCPTFAHGTWIYADAGHLTVAGALSVTQPLERAIRNALH